MRGIWVFYNIYFFDKGKSVCVCVSVCLCVCADLSRTRALKHVFISQVTNGTDEYLHKDSQNVVYIRQSDPGSRAVSC